MPTTNAEKHVISHKIYTPGSKNEKNLQLPYILPIVIIVEVQNWYNPIDIYKVKR